ncbi:cytochrome P450 [Armillaria luteobubalina]|uniref:Cytochrome P450 n=1 Tax=Armillaria luteobubalina TaxID=153913 RepID=A0AA39PZN4_9AGAR|nr:cytochrome P450 [Armillaria luteobubalina]
MIVSALSSFWPYAIVFFVWAVVKLVRIGRRELGLPPGPPTVPVLGNLNIFPTENIHYQFTRWARLYGGIYSLKVGPSTLIVITSPIVVKELMDGRSASTSDRPSSYMGTLITGGSHIVLKGNSKVWRALRKAVHTMLATQASEEHLIVQKTEGTQLMYDILRSPKDFFTHICRYSNSVMLTVVYGKRCPRYESPEAKAFYTVNHLWNHALEPGAHPPLDLLPFLRYLPGSWKDLCEQVKTLQRQLYFGLLDECQTRLQHGQGTGLLHREYLGGALLEGGSETTSFFLHSLILALTAFPEVQRKAQEEMDRVLGDQRTPTLDDFASLPYIQAVIKETHRFRPVAPLAIPHAMITTEAYHGYTIPKGATVFVNTWGIFHDPDAFENPEAFDPGRYLITEHGTKPGVDDSCYRSTLAFGSGRRICPGVNFANNSLALNAMNFIWAFQFSPPIDAATGMPLPVDIFAYSKGVTTAPYPFQCQITPRSDSKAKLIKAAFLDATDIFARFETSISAEDKEWVRNYRL